MPEIADTYTIPVILSFRDTAKQADKALGGSTIGKKFGKDFAKGAGDGLKSLEAEVSTASKAYEKLRDKAADALGKVRVEEERLAKARAGGKSDQIVAAEERLSRARRDSVRANKEAGDSHTVLLNAQKRLGDSSGDLDGKMGRLSGVAAKLGPSLAAAGAIAGGAALAGITALAGGVLLAGNRLYELGAQFDDLSDTLQVKTGLSGEALDALKGSVEKLGTTNVPSAFGEIGDVAAEVTRSLHLTGPAFDDVTSRLANLKRMGVDVNIRNLGKAFRGFGIQAKDQAPALNSLYEASTKSGLSIDDLTAAVAKGGPALRQLGLDFGASAGLVASFEEAGLDGEKGMAALTKATTYFAKENIPAKQGLQDTIAEIQRLGDTPEAVDLANKVFGARGGAAFYEAIKNGNLDLQSLRDTLQSTGIDINQVSDDTADWSEKWQLLKNDVAVALEPLATATFDTVNEELGKLADWTKDHKGEIVDFFVGVGQAAITGIDITLDAIGQLAQGIGQFIEPFGDIQGAMLDFQAFQAEIRGDFDTARELRDQAQAAYGWGEGIDAAGAAMRNFDPQQLRDKLNGIGDAAKGSSDKVGALGSALGGLPKTTSVILNLQDGLGNPMTAGDYVRLLTTPAPAAAPPPIPNLAQPRRAGGGPITGPGGGTSDIIPIWASNGEHMWTADEVNYVGGQGAMYRMRAAARAGMFRGFAAGGAIGPDVQAAMAMVGTPYSQAARNDCSGMVARVISRALGLPESGLMSTKNAQTWLAERGFVSGKGGPGMIRVGWYDKGPNPNDGHMAMTLSDGTNAEAGGSHGNFLVGAGAKGADDPQFDHHMYLPQLFGEGPAGNGSVTMLGGGAGGAGGGTPGYGPNGEVGTYTVDQADVADKQARLAEADANIREKEAKLRELDADAKESDKIRAQADVDKAKADKTKAENELAEARQGKFTATKDAGGSSGKGGLGGLGEIGSIAGSFLKETFGFDGSFFPDIANLMPVQFASNLLNSFKGPIQGALDGKLGIQTPGWTPEMGEEGLAALQGTSGGAFGMPNIAPPMPPDGQHAGTGAPPGPPMQVTIDQSQQFNNSQLGWDPQEVNRVRDINQQRRALPRLSGIGMGT